jgi:deoxycytidine triphosphate deaminase
MLSDILIEERFDEIFDPGTADRSKVRAAKYYLTLGHEFLILPDNRRYGENTPCRRGFVLEPGQTALVSTKERISIPVDLSAIFGPVFDLSDSGILFFGGMLIDPGFGGFVEGNEHWHPKPEPLSFYLANVGSQAYPLHPGTDRIASIAFIPLEGERAKTTFPKRLETTTAEKVRTELFSLSIEEVLVGVLALAAVPAVFVGSFYLWVTALVKLRNHPKHPNRRSQAG